MVLEFPFPGCGTRYSIAAHRVRVAGLRMRCPKCSASFLIQPPAMEKTEPVITLLDADPPRPEATVDDPPAPDELEAEEGDTQ